MPLVPVAECHTAADVWRVAREAAARRRRGRTLGQVIAELPPERRAKVIARTEQLIAALPAPTPPAQPEPTIRWPLCHRLVRQAVADAYGLPVDVMSRSGRTAAHVQARSVSMLLCRILLKSSMPQIGYWHGGRDHTTVLCALKKLSRLREQLEARLTTKNHIAEWAELAVELWPPIVMKR